MTLLTLPAVEAIQQFCLVIAALIVLSGHKLSEKFDLERSNLQGRFSKKKKNPKDLFAGFLIYYHYSDFTGRAGKKYKSAYRIT